MNTEEKLSYDLTLKEIPLSIGGEDYVLVELTGKGRDSYLNNVGSRVRTTKTGETAGIKNFDGMQAFLLTISLFKLNGDGSKTNVTQSVVQSWPAGVVAKLFEKSKELSDLGQEEEEGEEGND